MTLSETSSRTPFPADAFSDVTKANEKFVTTFASADLPAIARRGLALVTCMDSRIEPLSILGMEAGDVKILRNAGARVTDDVMRTLVLATYLLGVNRVLVMPHTDCKMASGSEAQIHSTILAEHGVDTRSIEIRTVSDQLDALITDVIRIRAFALLPKDLVVAGAIYDTSTGRVAPVDV